MKKMTLVTKTILVNAKETMITKMMTTTMTTKMTTTTHGDARAREGTNARRGGVDVGWGRWDAR